MMNKVEYIYMMIVVQK